MKKAQVVAIASVNPRMYEETDGVNWECVDPEVGEDIRCLSLSISGSAVSFFSCLSANCGLKSLSRTPLPGAPRNCLRYFHEVIALDLIVVVNCLLVIVFGPTFRKRFADEYNSLRAEHRP